MATYVKMVFSFKIVVVYERQIYGYFGKNLWQRGKSEADAALFI